MADPRHGTFDHGPEHDPEDTGDHAVDVARRLRKARIALGYEDKDEFGEYAGLSQSLYNRFENGRRVITLQAAMKLYKRYGLSLDWIYMGDPSGIDPRLWKRIRELPLSDYSPM
jgi:transcriptional regulator with XRE-family HTH domain